MPTDRIDERLDRYHMIERLQIAVAVGIAFVFIYAFAFVRTGFWAVLGVGMLSAGASLLAGFLVGFIFGIPRIPKDAPTAPQRQPRPQTGGAANDQSTSAPLPATNHSPVEANSNLVEISDWLTKILVGVGLVELEKIPGKLKALATYVGSGLRACDSVTCQNVSEAVALGIFIFFFCAGFLIAYLWARLYLQRAFSELLNLASDVDKAWDYADMADEALDDNRLADAIRFIDLAVSSDPRNAKAHQLKGVILKAMATQSDQSPETKTRLLQEALDEATQSSKLRPSVGGAFYNIACYMALLGRDKKDALKNLQEAFRLDPKLKAKAPTDDDLKTLWPDDDFKKLTSATS